MTTKRRESLSNGVGRRRFIKQSSVLMGAALSGPDIRIPASQADSPHSPSLVKNENKREGARDWQLTRVRIQGGTRGFRSTWIEGYCSRQSIEGGQTLDIMVSTDPPARFIIEVFRLGFYGGLGGRSMTRLGPFQGRKQPDPPVVERRLRECRWESSVSLKIPADWPSGVYLGRLSTLPEKEQETYWQSYCIFVVRDRRRADILFQCSDNTWQAYNRWPDDYSLYTDPRGAHAPDVSVSFDRPYGKYVQIFDNPQSVGSGEFLLWEYPLCFWLEQQGYDVTYCSNQDVLEPSGVTRCKTFLSVGHDEYWDLRQYQAVRESIQAGVNVLWLCGNSVYMVTPFSDSSDGRPNRVLTRAASYGEMSKEEKATYGRMMGPFPYAGPDESLIIGARTIVPFNGGGDWICTKPGHWIFEGTGMKKGEAIPGLVGWEFHGNPAEIAGLEVVAEGTALAGGTVPARWTATIYPGPRGNFVFNASTIFWSQGLATPPGHMLPWSHWSRPHGPDPRVQRITRNLLERALG
jgi:N,N-dimethylformamidase beta subunit-like, C-terminal